MLVATMRIGIWWATAWLWLCAVYALALPRGVDGQRLLTHCALVLLVGCFCGSRSTAGCSRSAIHAHNFLRTRHYLPAPLLTALWTLLQNAATDVGDRCQ